MLKDESLAKAWNTNKFIKIYKYIYQKKEEEEDLPALKKQTQWNLHRPESWNWHQSKTDEQDQVVVEVPDSIAPQNTNQPDNNTSPHFTSIKTKSNPPPPKKKIVN